MRAASGQHTSSIRAPSSRLLTALRPLLQGQVEGGPAGGAVAPAIDELTLTRFLLADSCVVEKSEARLRATLAWRAAKVGRRPHAPTHPPPPHAVHHDPCTPPPKISQPETRFVRRVKGIDELARTAPAHWDNYSAIRVRRWAGVDVEGRCATNPELLVRSPPLDP